LSLSQNPLETARRGECQATTSQAAEIFRFVTRARLQSGRKRNGINVGFSPCGNFLGHFGQIQDFSRSLFSRAGRATNIKLGFSPCCFFSVICSFAAAKAGI
jgi:hypothetical protein